MLAILKELIEAINKNDLGELLTWYSHKSSLQHFGFLLEELETDDNLSEQIIKHLQQSKFPQCYAVQNSSKNQVL